MSGRILISCREDDSLTGRLGELLLAHFGRAKIYANTTKPDGDFVEATENAVGACDVLIAIIGKRWLMTDAQGSRRFDNPDDFVRREIATALKRDIRVIPVLVDAASMPRPTDLPDDLKPLVGRLAFEVSHDRFRTDSELLIDAIEGALGKAEAERLEAQRRKTAEKERLEAQRREAISVADRSSKKTGGRIFISYRREDRSMLAGRLGDCLSVHFGREKIFMDVDVSAQSDVNVKLTEKAVAQCDVLIAVIGPDWLTCKDEQDNRLLDNAEDSVRTAIATALKRDIRVIPVLVEGASMPWSPHLPDDLRSFVYAHRHPLELSHDRFQPDSFIRAIEVELYRADAEREEKERLDAKKREREEKERLKTERREREKKERLEAERRETEKKERLEAERHEHEEKERQEAERVLKLQHAKNSKAEIYDVFLCYNKEDRSAVREISQKLVEQGIKPWLEEEQIGSGTPWRTALEQQIESIKSVAVFVGESGLGPWQNLELQAILSQFVKRECPVIPVFLPSAKTTPEMPWVLANLHWVDFRVTNPDPLKQLIWAITATRIFICYRRDDSSGHAGRLCDALQKKFGKAQIFMDVAGVEPGADFVDVIETSVIRCHVLLVVIGRNWLAYKEKGLRRKRRLDDLNDYVRIEIRAALERGIRIIPILVQGAQIPRADSLPEDIRKLTRKQAVDLRDSGWNNDVTALISKLESASSEADRQRQEFERIRETVEKMGWKVIPKGET